jgi:hypothetical protein
MGRRAYALRCKALVLMPGVQVHADAAMPKGRSCEKPDAAASDDGSFHATFHTSATESMHHDRQWFDKSHFGCANARGNRYQPVAWDDDLFSETTLCRDAIHVFRCVTAQVFKLTLACVACPARALRSHSPQGAVVIEATKFMPENDVADAPLENMEIAPADSGIGHSESSAWSCRRRDVYDFNRLVLGYDCTHWRDGSSWSSIRTRRDESGKGADFFRQECGSCAIARNSGMYSVALP